MRPTVALSSRIKLSHGLHNAPKKVVLTVGLLDVDDGVVILEEVDFLNVVEVLDTCRESAAKETYRTSSGPT